MARVTTAKAAGEELGLKHIEVIRRIRKGDIEASKFGWSWAIEVEEVERVKQKPWYISLMKRRHRVA